MSSDIVNGIFNTAPSVPRINSAEFEEQRMRTDPSVWSPETIEWYSDDVLSDAASNVTAYAVPRLFLSIVTPCGSIISNWKPEIFSSSLFTLTGNVYLLPARTVKDDEYTVFLIEDMSLGLILSELLSVTVTLHRALILLPSVVVAVIIVLPTEIAVMVPSDTLAIVSSSELHKSSLLFAVTGCIVADMVLLLPTTNSIDVALRDILLTRPNFDSTCKNG